MDNWDITIPLNARLFHQNV